MKDRKQIKIHLESVNEVKFMLNLADDLLEKIGDGPNIGFGHIISSVSMDQGLISFIFGVQYAITNIPVLESRYEFVFKVDPIQEAVKIENNSIEIKALMPHFINVAIGTMRGIIVVKTAGTPLAKYPLPLFDPMIVMKDICANMQGHKEKQ